MGVAVDALLRIGDAQLAEHLQHLFPGLGLGHALVVLQQALGHLVAHFIDGVQAGHGVLEHHGHLGAAEGAHLGAVGLFDLFQPVFRDLAVPQSVVLDLIRLDGGVTSQETHDGIHGHALAAAGLAYHGQGGAPLELERDVLHDPDFFPVGNEGGIQIFYVQNNILTIHTGLPPYCCLASSTSRKPSPKKLMASTNRLMARPGNTQIHH